MKEQDSWWEDYEEESDVESDMDRCPNCHRWIYDDAVSCVYCGHYLADADHASSVKPWVFVTTLILCLLFVLSWIVTFF